METNNNSAEEIVVEEVVSLYWCAIKYVLPALTGVTYQGFEIANGSDASLSYIFITHGSYEGKKASPKEIKKIRADLEQYCGQDTSGMIKVLERLEGFVASKSNTKKG
jgi:hypothetical protein